MKKLIRKIRKFEMKESHWVILVQFTLVVVCWFGAKPFRPLANGMIWGIAVMQFIRFLTEYQKRPNLRQLMRQFKREILFWQKMADLNDTDKYKVLHQIDKARFN